MKSKLLHDDGLRTFAVVLDGGEEAIGALRRFAKDQNLSAAHFTGLGAFKRVVLGFFEWEKKDYRRIEVEEQVEVVSLVGDVTLDAEGDPTLHPHIVVARADGTALGGHLLEAEVRPTLEVMLVETPGWLRRRHDPESGLALIDISTGEERR